MSGPTKTSMSKCVSVGVVWLIGTLYIVGFPAVVKSQITLMPSRARIMGVFPHLAAQQSDAKEPSTDGSSCQPFQFSHKQHADLKMECTYCHSSATTGDKATFPLVSKCMICHAAVARSSNEITKLAALAPETRLVPEAPIYVLPDFVFFSHVRHKTAGIDCQACHGDVWVSDSVPRQLHMKMSACVECHRASKAPVACDTCHEPFQQ